MKRFGQIIICTGIQPGFLLVYGILAREHDDRCLTATVTILPAHINARKSGQFPVKYYQVIFVDSQPFSTIATFVHALRKMTISLQKINYQGRQLPVIFHY